ncbi:MAG: hypothetical protein ACE5EF_01135 [Dehalococcoidia bacterium]
MVAAAAILAVSLPAGATAIADPPIPTELRLFGSVLVDGSNVEPRGQPLLAIVNGRVCGETTIFLNPEGEPVDGGLTVYVLTVAAAGSGANEHEGCGEDGDPITLYLPGKGLLASSPVAFSSGWARADLSLTTGPQLARNLLPLIATDAGR